MVEKSSRMDWKVLGSKWLRVFNIGENIVGKKLSNPPMKAVLYHADGHFGKRHGPNIYKHLTEELRKKREQEIKDKEKELRDYRNQKFGYEGELFKKRQELIKPIQDKVFDAVQKVAKQGALDFIFAKGSEMIMLYSNAKYDKSDEVLTELGVAVTKNKDNQNLQKKDNK